MAGQVIQNMCSKKEVLALLFRQARILKTPITLGEMAQHQILKGPPQSIVSIPKEKLSWLVKQLEA